MSCGPKRPKTNWRRMVFATIAVSELAMARPPLYVAFRCTSSEIGLSQKVVYGLPQEASQSTGETAVVWTLSKLIDLTRIR